MATIKDIALKAGVSASTVSNVLHGNTARVSPQTLEKVRAILKAENYAPNMGAVILARNNSKIVGVIMFVEPRPNETVIEDPFTATVLGAIEEGVRESGHFLMIRTTADKDEVLRLAATWKLAGLILLWVPSDVCSAIQESTDTPVVFIDCYFNDDGLPYHNVGLADEDGGYLVARYLLSMGHERFAFLANTPDFSGNESARVRGIARALSERGLLFGPEHLIKISKDKETRHGQYREILADRRNYTALFFSADYYAADAIVFFQDNGIDVPARMSVVGFDDNHYARLVSPRLTTVQQDVFTRGKRAVEMLMALVSGTETSEAVVRYPVRLVVRDSVRRIDGTAD